MTHQAAAPHDRMPGAHEAAGEATPDDGMVHSKNAEGSPALPPDEFVRGPYRWPQVKDRSKPAHEMRTGPRASKWDDLEKT